MIAPEALTWLEKGERSIAEARAELAAGATTLELVGSALDVKIDGEPITADVRVLTRETRVSLGNGAELIIRPPATIGNAELRLAEALARHNNALSELGVESIAVERQRNDAAREAAGDVRTLSAHLDASAPADPELGLAAGTPALKLLVAGLPASPEGEGDDEETPSTRDFGLAVEAAETALARAEGAQESAATAPGLIGEQERPLAAAEAGAASDFQNAANQLRQIEEGADFANLEQHLTGARERAAEAAAVLGEAERNAGAYDVRSIERGIPALPPRRLHAAGAAHEADPLGRLRQAGLVDTGRGRFRLARGSSAVAPLRPNRQCR